MASATAHPGGTWGAYIEALPKRTGMTMKQIAERAGIARGTFYKWIKGSGVTVDSVKRVAQAVDDPEDMALRAAGGQLIDEESDPQLRDIYASDLTDEEKQELIDYVLSERSRSEESLRRHVQMVIRAREGKAS